MREASCAALLALCAVATPLGAGAQSLEWATRAGGASGDTARAVALDAAGNSYVVGTFIAQATFGAGEPNETVLTSAGAVPSQDLFVAKYSPSGALLWARGVGGTDPSSGGDAGADVGRGAAVDAAGNVFVTGALASVTALADFGNGVTLTTPGPFTAKYDANGIALWATRLEASGGHGMAVGVDGVGNSYTGGFAPFPGVGGETATIWKLSPSGGVVWLRQAAPAGGASARILGISVDAAGNSHITGRLQLGSFVFGQGEPTETTLTDGNSTGEAFFAKYDAMGDLIWATQSVGPVGAWGQSIAIDGVGSSHATGFFHGATTFGAGGPNETTLVAATATLSDLFIAKYDVSGGLLWARPVLATGNAGGTGIAVAGGSLYVTGWFAGFVTFAPGQGNEVTVSPSADGADVLLAKYDADGALVWARTDGGDTASPPAFDQATGIAVGGGGAVLVSGEFPGTATLGTGDANQTSLVSAGQTDLFVARYVDSGAGQPLDLDVSQLRVAKRVSLSRGQTIDLSLVVENGSTVSGSADATIVGVQAGAQVYNHTLSVTDPPGNGRTRFDFPSFTPAASGQIVWTATIVDVDADPDTASKATIVVP